MAATKSTGRTTPKKVQDEGTLEPTPASSWKKGVQGTLIRVPSGNTALVRAPGMEVFLREGVIPNSLLPIIQEAMVQGAAPDKATQSKMLDDPQKLIDIIDLANSITVYCCLDPKVLPIPTNAEGEVLPLGDKNRLPDVLYVDEVDFNDKMAIFSFAVGGPADLEKFLPES